MEKESLLTEKGRVAGIDYGTVRIGVSLCDFDRKIASPWENYTRRNVEEDAKYFQKIVQECKITLFVVGLPVHMSGDESEKSKEARKFGAWLASVTKIPVCYFDERYSSCAADELMCSLGGKKKRKARRDKIAAYVILSRWLEFIQKRKKMNHFDFLEISEGTESLEEHI
ncbi:MAG: Holliday junction resolvase RuvX [Planctomycetia bacterium]|nr:Holliday junction resolvase RuvX [Planctomycetia bacterium]